MSAVKISSEKEVTIDDIVKDADVLWKKCQHKQITDKLADELWDQHKEIAKAYPVVFKYLVYMKQYDSRVLRKYLEYIKKNPWQNQKEFIDMQAEYVVFLFRKVNPHSSKLSVLQCRSNARKILQEEHDELKRLTEAAAKKIEQREERNAAERLRNTKEFYDEYKAEIAQGLHIRGVSDIPCDNYREIEVTPVAPEMSIDNLLD